MQKIRGTVVEIYIPDEDKTFQELMGFKVDVDGDLLDIVVPQNKINTNILREDEVLIIKQNISGVDFIDIEPIMGVDYE